MVALDSGLRSLAGDIIDVADPVRFLVMVLTVDSVFSMEGLACEG